MNHAALKSTLSILKPLGLASLIFLICACQPKPAPGPDQTAGGALLGAGIGAGAGMVIGNQVSHIGPGAAVGAGFGLIAGALTGLGQDTLEETQVDFKGELSSLRAQTAFNRQQLGSIQENYDNSSYSEMGLQPFQVFFEDNATNLKAGSINELEQIAENIKASRAAVNIQVSGHTDESGSPQYNSQLSEARAKNVASYLQARGISADKIIVNSFGSGSPIATNSTPEGRQLNRRVEIRLTK